MTAQEIDRIECAIRHIESSLDVDPWAKDIAVKAMEKQIQTIEPERKTGKWERKYSRPGVYADLCWHCSICGGKFLDTYANMWKYCPDCGAKMEETE